MRAYITGTSAISPQFTFENTDYLKEILSPAQDYFTAVEPDYKAFIDPKLSRRMARIIKMSIASAQSCLVQAGVKQPDAIIVGTGLGCLQDTEKFLADLIENNEGLLSPTAFIQSTHNTIAGQIALVLGCPNHNFTFVQRGHSFENALQDALLQLEEGSNRVLLGGVDEVTPTLFKILTNTGCANSPAGRYPTLNSTNQKPALGEGATFFLLTSTPSDKSIACIDDMQIVYGAHQQSAIQDWIMYFLNQSNVDINNVDAVMMGYNGYKQDDAVYHALHNSMFKDKTILSFKNLCGEYFTSSAFGLHLAANILDRQVLFNNVLVDGEGQEPINNILFFNHHQEKYYTITLLSRCRPL